MSCFRKVFGKKKKRTPSVDQAVEKLEDTLKMLTEQQESLEKQIEECILTAKKSGISNERVALRALKKKKQLEKKLERVDDILTTLELQKDALENSPVNAAVMDSIKNANEALKKANVKLDIDHVQNIMGDVNEQQAVGDDVLNIIRNSIVIDVTDEELANELEELMASEVNEKLNQVPDFTKWPSILIEPKKEKQKEKHENPLVKPEKKNDMEILESSSS